MAIAKKTLKGALTPVEVRALVAMYAETAHDMTVIEIYKQTDDALLAYLVKAIPERELDKGSQYLRGIEPAKIKFIELLRLDPKAALGSSVPADDTPEEPETQVEEDMPVPRPVAVAPARPAVAPVAGVRPAVAPVAPAVSAPKPAAPAAPAPAAPKAPAAPAPAAPKAPVPAAPKAPTLAAPKASGATSPAATPVTASKEVPSLDIDAINAAITAALIPLVTKLSEIQAQISALEEKLEEKAVSGSEDLGVLSTNVTTILNMAIARELSERGFMAEDLQANLESLAAADISEPATVVAVFYSPSEEAPAE